MRDNSSSTVEDSQATLIISQISNLYFVDSAFVVSN